LTGFIRRGAYPVEQFFRPFIREKSGIYAMIALLFLYRYPSRYAKNADIPMFRKLRHKFVPVAK